MRNRRRLRLPLSGIVLSALAALLAGCGDTGSRAEAVDSVPGPATGQTGAMETASDGASEATRRGGDGPESMLRFGLFGPVVPALGTEGYESDCSFENDPYETCL